MQPARFIAYYRVSTDRQGRSGLGLEAQQESVRQFVRSRNGEVVSEYTEIESGRLHNRKQLQAALDHAAQTGAVLLIAKLDRLARSVSFITKLLDGKVPFVSCDMPEANRMMLQISAVFAEHEAKLISDRTKAAIAAKRARGEEWGTNRAKRTDAQAFAESIRADIQTLIHAGITKPAALAKALNDRNVRTSGGQQWGPGQVVRLLRKLDL